MGKIRFILSIWICKLLIFAGKIAGKKSSATPGVYALKICPDILKILSKQVKYKTIAVCGTNGKTTTNNTIYKILTDKGYKVCCNRVGANMLSGIVTAFCESANIFGKLDADYASLEMDEAYSVKIFDHLIPDIMVVTNLFRDQLDRYGEVEVTASYLKKALSKSENIELVINGDDPICLTIGKSHKKFKTFGISESTKMNFDKTSECQFCPECRSELKYNYRHYSQLGDFYCENCNYKREKIDYEATNIDVSNNLKFTVNNNINIDVSYRGFYNIYNILSAMAVCDLCQIPMEEINGILASYKPQIGRMEQFDLNKPVILNLAKNPAGFNQAIYTVMADERKKDILLGLNNNETDGVDISWIWDVEFEKLKDEKVSSLGCAGMRCKELALRLKYADVDKNTTTYNSIKNAIKDMLKQDGEVLYILVNYTVIFEAQAILKSIEEEMKNEH